MTLKAIEITTPVGRLVAGHPMETNPVTDQTTNVVKLQADGVTPRTQTFVGLAIPKDPGAVDWKQTPWGQQILQAALEGWPNGEYNAPTFSWKVQDGDSMIPNKKGKKNCDREGYPGHWVIYASTELGVKSYHAGRYAVTDIIKNAKEIKRGDYGRLVIFAKGNAPSQTPGVYVNPDLFELVRAGIEIVGEGGADAATAFGASAGVLPVGAQVDPNIAAPATQPGAVPAAVTAPAANTAPAAGAPTPAANNFLNPAPAANTAPVAPAQAPLYTFSGGMYTKEALIAAGHTEAQIATYPSDNVPH